jgi:hypothetical protein
MEQAVAKAVLRAWAGRTPVDGAAVDDYNGIFHVETAFSGREAPSARFLRKLL